MNIEFYGAAGCVTGSSHILHINDKKILLDCGMFQGKDEKERNNNTFSFNPQDIDFVILSHAHIDHSGRIPMLYKEGFKGEILCTEGTKDLCNIMLQDSGHIQEMETEWLNRKRRRKALPEVTPLYTAIDAKKSIELFKGCTYNEWIELFDGFKIKFTDAGHILGSAITEMLINENKHTTKLVYSGDLGNINIPILKDPTYIDNADYIIMETTYGDKLHGDVSYDLKELVNIIHNTVNRGGNIIIPSFAIGRTQEVIYALNNYVESGILKGIKVYVDSPLASESTEVFKKYTNYFDTEASKLVDSGDNPLEFTGLTFTKSPQESMDINNIQSGAVIISSSGMCDAGRIKHHLKHNLWREECSVVFVGYQAEGTLGKRILNGDELVKILGDEIAVKAHIYNLQGLSGHADKNGLLNWVKGFKNKPKNIFLVHGDEEAQESFYKILNEEGFNSHIVKLGEDVYV
ncbi:metallo-beta-lactamase family protein [Clostridium pascui]|uniref:MBL fold metallo-hydrolase RNA specificity domain-containing protein n=1 Tax=Clostridium pascui TaxID=46609 RepID=UPI001959C71E|nr:MBL fold metallo-hydrolase [Clostridium pascui]MBM7871111.1 metallo-beta-lactamase family protein [Clostridium pascui]